MGRTGNDMFIVSSPRQWSVLASPLRLEILEQFAAAGSRPSNRHGASSGASIADIARRMGRRPDSLYHHMRLLINAGLLVVAGTRRAGKRDEALYRPVARTIAVPCDPGKPASVRAAMHAVASTFRLAEREMRQAIERRATVAQGPQRNFLIRRMPTRVCPAALRRINRHMDAIIAIAEHERQRDGDAKADSSDAAPVSITIALLPMTSRRSRAVTPKGSPAC